MHLTRFPTFLVTVHLVDIFNPVKHAIISLLFPLTLSLAIITLLLLCTPLPNPPELVSLSEKHCCFNQQRHRGHECAQILLLGHQDELKAATLRTYYSLPGGTCLFPNIHLNSSNLHKSNHTVYSNTLSTIVTHYPTVWTVKCSVIGTRV